MVFNVCEDTYRSGWQYGCEKGCEEDAVCFGVTGGPAFNARRDETCKAYINMTPRPSMGNSEWISESFGNAAGAKRMRCMSGLRYTCLQRRMF
jgi:hypothetical protein